ncbi:MAG TPA: purine-nucleoside phosphorylase [Geminicoccaceae bacterium]|jgi:xanthosine phosphorylase|nr:purine-nucleoside phosphorylase [Geminicoccaceae bacterium]
MQDLFDAGRAAFENAHAPYSNFKVGAAVRARSGRVFCGANVENASYPEGNCAEASAIAAMVAAGERRITEALVVAVGERLCTPCGGCRQRLAEFAGPDLPIHLCDPQGLRRTVTLGELLPLSFAFDEPPERGPQSKPEREGGGTPQGSGGTAGRQRKGSEKGCGHAAAGPRDDAGAAVEVIRAKVPNFAPRVGLILGSGLGGIAAAIEQATAIEYVDLPGFPAPSIDGHAGRLLLGRFAGVEVACLQGRVHLYEGVPAAAVNVLPRTLKGLGCEVLILTNAAGSLRPEIEPGALALIDDHINLLGQNPLVGPNDPTVGVRFPDLCEVYDLKLRAHARAVAARLDIPLRSGVYLATLGPSFETPAEIRAFRALGADLVGMSTVPEAISARHCGLKVVGFSIVTNLAAGLGDQTLSHEQTLAVAAQAADRLQRLLEGLLQELARDGRDPA